MVTVVTQFITSDNTDTGDLAEIKRFYVQDGKTVRPSARPASDPRPPSPSERENNNNGTFGRACTGLEPRTV